jgi:hypothetical protein
MSHIKECLQVIWTDPRGQFDDGFASEGTRVLPRHRVDESVKYEARAIGEEGLGSDAGDGFDGGVVASPPNEQRLDFLVLRGIELFGDSIDPLFESLLNGYNRPERAVQFSNAVDFVSDHRNFFERLNGDGLLTIVLKTIHLSKSRCIAITLPSISQSIESSSEHTSDLPKEKVGNPFRWTSRRGRNRNRGEI